MLDPLAIVLQGIGFGRGLMALEGLIAVPSVPLDEPIFTRTVDAVPRRIGNSAPTLSTRRVGSATPV